MACNGLTSKNLRNPCEKNPIDHPESCCTTRSTTISLVEGKETFFNRLLSRDSSKGFSSRIYYRVVGNVPFEWEKQPGKPKVISESAPLWPLSPPPAMLRVPMSPLLCSHQESKGSTQRSLWFWKKKKSAKAQKSQSQILAGSDGSFESWSSEGDSTWSSSSVPRNSSSSSLSSSSSIGSLETPVGKRSGLENRNTVKDLRKGRRKEGLEWVWSCSVWGFPGVMVCMVPEA